MLLLSLDGGVVSSRAVGGEWGGGQFSDLIWVGFEYIGAKLYRFCRKQSTVIQESLRLRARPRNFGLPGLGTRTEFIKREFIKNRTKKT